MRIRFGDFLLDDERRELRRGADVVHLSPRAFDLLAILVSARPRIVSQQTLSDRLWPHTFVGRGSLHNLVSELRTALDDGGRNIIRTAYANGFAFTPTATAEDAPHRKSCLLVIGDYEFTLRQGENIVGRDWDVEVHIDSPSVSRRHACIVIDESEATLQDLSSKNGTKVGNRRVRSSVRLADGDEILFGMVYATFVARPDPQSTDTAFK